MLQTLLCSWLTMLICGPLQAPYVPFHPAMLKVVVADQTTGLLLLIVTFYLLPTKLPSVYSIPSLLGSPFHSCSCLPALCHLTFHTFVVCSTTNVLPFATLSHWDLEGMEQVYSPSDCPRSILWAFSGMMGTLNAFPALGPFLVV